MVLTSEQSDNIKEQLVLQIEKSFPEEKKEFAKSQIQSMDSEQLEEFLKKNNLEFKDGKLHSLSEGSGTTNCIFCSIVLGDMESHKIAEGEESIAVLEINPLSKGHTIIIPKDHVSSSDKIPSSAFSLGKEVSKKIKENLNPNRVDISTSSMFGHEIINIVPIYGEEAPTNKSHAEPEELNNLKAILEIKKSVLEEKKPAKETILDAKNIWLPKRIP